MRAIISDVHANLEALQAVLRDIEQQGADEIYCLGDIIDYGPNPRECIDLLMGCRVVLMGDRDHATLYDEGGEFGTESYQSAVWTRNELESISVPEEERARRWNFLAGNRQYLQEGPFLFVHGSPSHPLQEGIFSEDIFSDRMMDRLFKAVERYCFHGRTHIPGIITEYREFLSPADVDFHYHLTAEKTLCNVGSVGQSLDGDWRASYVLVDGHDIHYRRIEYDIETTERKLDAIPDLPNFLRSPFRRELTEQAWRTSFDPDQLLEFFQSQDAGPAMERKIRFFGAACCRRVWALLEDERSRAAIQTLEDYLNGTATDDMLGAARKAACHAMRDALNRHSRLGAQACTASLSPGLLGRNSAEFAARAASSVPSLLSDEQRAVLRAERRAQADLLRHIVGNPFRRVAAPAVWPAAVVQLAEAQNAGNDCAFALHDALIEAGYPELAAHFREPVHPKGCWVVDLILGKA